MKGFKKYIKTVLGALIVGVAINLFFFDYKIVPAGIFGFSVLYANKTTMNLSLAMFLMNTLFLMIGILTLPKEKYRKLILPLILVPVFVYLTKDINTIIDVTSADTLLIAIFGGVMLGFGERFVYQEGFYLSGDDIIEQIGKTIVGPNGSIANYVVDAVIVIFTYFNFGIEIALYSTVSIAIIELMRKRSIIGISESKVFYIITSEETQVKKFIMNELHYDLTIFDVKGGYSQNKNRVLMSAIPTRDYYKLREGIKAIDPKAFISITDSYEVVNQNLEIRGVK